LPGSAISGSIGSNEVDKKERSMSNLVLSLFQEVNGGNLGPYNPNASEWWAWAGASCFFVGVLGFSIMGLRATEKGRGHFAHKILVVLVAMTSYIALAFTQGAERAGEDTYFSYARFIDWSVTTPLLLLGLALLALPRARDSLPLVLSIMAVDLYMIATGLFAGLSGEGRGVWWVWFIVSSLAFVVLYAMIFGPLAKKAREKVKAGETMQRSEDPVERYLGTVHAGEGKWFGPMAGLLALIWLVYPVVFFLDEQGIGAYTHPTSDALYTIVDVTAKVVYGFIFLGGILAIEKRAADAMGRSPQGMDEEEYARFTSELTRHEGAESRHKLAALSAHSEDAARERGSTAPSGGETIYEAKPKDAHEDREDGDDVLRTPRDG
jgi:bacteriorhodopsin